MVKGGVREGGEGHSVRKGGEDHSDFLRLSAPEKGMCISREEQVVYPGQSHLLP